MQILSPQWDGVYTNQFEIMHAFDENNVMKSKLIGNTEKKFLFFYFLQVKELKYWERNTVLVR